jgi:hypothetical protein
MKRLIDLRTSEFEEEYVLWDVDRNEVSGVRHRATGRAFIKMARQNSFTGGKTSALLGERPRKFSLFLSKTEDGLEEA